MFIDFLVIETAGAAQVIHEPKWPAIQSAIKALNGSTKTLVCLVKIHDCHMDLGGGAHDRCVASATRDNQTFYLIVEPARGTDPVEAKVNGQVNNYPAELLVAKDAALIAARLFAEKGEFTPAVHWRSTAEAPGPTHPAATT